MTLAAEDHFTALASGEYVAPAQPNLGRLSRCSSYRAELGASLPSAVVRSGRKPPFQDNICGHGIAGGMAETLERCTYTYRARFMSKMSSNNCLAKNVYPPLATAIGIAILLSSASPAHADNVSTQNETSADVSDEALATIKSSYAAFSAGRLDDVLRLMAPDVIWTYHAPVQEVPFSGTYKGVDGVRNFFETDAKYVIVNDNIVKSYISDGTRVAAIGEEHGTVRSTGKQFVAAWVHVYEVKNGKIVKFDEYIDSAAIAAALRQGSRPTK